MIHHFTIICAPGDKYRQMTELQAAKHYTDMAIGAFDKQVTFGEEYLMFKDQADLVVPSFTKQGVEIILSLYANQPVKRIGDIEGDFVSSSYMFNPEPRTQGCKKKGLILPDLDIVLLKGGSQTPEAALTIAKLYLRNGWEAFIEPGEIERTRRMPIDNTRFGQTIIDMAVPQNIFELANKRIGYDLERLCYRTSQKQR
ncbi:MAG: hypothetical protein V1866_00395 [archaeon]